jgi:methionine-rich copper-binding protein CopC
MTVALSAPAQAHSTLSKSEPAEGAKLSAPPNEIRLWFTEPIKAGLSTIDVRDAAGKRVDQRDLRPDEKDRNLVRLSLSPQLGPGTYRVTWSAVAQDLHVTRGTFSFRVGP